MFAHARRRLTVFQTVLTKHMRYVCFGMFAFSLLAVRLVAECRRACELDDVTHGTEYDSIQAIKERSNVWRELKRVTESLAANDVSLFLRGGRGSPLADKRDILRSTEIMISRCLTAMYLD